MIAVYAPQRRLLAFHGLSKVERCPRVNHLFSPAFFLPPYFLPVSRPLSCPCLVHRRSSLCVIVVTTASHRDIVPLRGTIKRRAIDRYLQTTTVRPVFDVRCVRSRNRGRVRSPLSNRSSFYYRPEEHHREGYPRDL